MLAAFLSCHQLVEYVFPFFVDLVVFPICGVDERSLVSTLKNTCNIRVVNNETIKIYIWLLVGK